MLTKNQHKLITFIEKFMQENSGVPPSYDEMKDATGVNSKSGIHRLIIRLEERGFIRRIPHRARAIEILNPISASKELINIASLGCMVSADIYDLTLTLQLESPEQLLALVAKLPIKPDEESQEEAA